MEDTLNPLLSPFDTPYNVPPFDRIETSHFKPAIETAVERAKADIDAIANNAEPATFDNTIIALENAGADLERVLGVFFPLLSALSSDEMMALSVEMMPLLSEYSTSIPLNEKLWERVRTVHDDPATQQRLTDPADHTLLRNTYDMFASNGALLEGDDREQFRNLSRRLSELTTTFEQNVLRELNACEILLTANQIDGIPAHILEEAAALAAERGKPEGNYLFTLQMPTYMAVMKFATDRSVRQQFYTMYSKRNTAGEFDNQAIVREIVEVRARLATLLGSPTFAAHTLRRRMARTPEAVNNLLIRLREAYIEPGRKELEELQEFASQQTGENFTLRPWDYSFWFTRLKKARFDYDEQALRPYFELSRVIDGVFSLAKRLYGLQFRELTDVPVYHPDVKVFEVSDENGVLGVLYTDFFPRSTKHSGAWMTGFKDQWIEPDGTDSRPVVSIVMNFTKPTATEPSLLTPGEVRTFLHEFGHALHGLLTRVRYRSLSGTSVHRDFVELPSQFNENFLTRREFLDSFARHYKTGEPLPESEIDKIIGSDQFGAARACLRQLSFGMLDMAWHTLTAEELAAVSDIEQFERQATASVSLIEPMPGEMTSVQFGHIFSGGYAAGYYSYKWAEVLDADAFGVFLREGVFNRDTAARFRHEILGRGGSEEPDILYRRFRGSEPSIESLLRRDGILK